MVGLQATVFKKRLGAKLNGIVNYETWVPSEKMMAPARASSSRSTRRAPAPKASIRSATISAAGAMPTSACSGEAIEGAKSIEDDKIADYIRKTTFKTIMGDWSYGPGGEWTKSGMMQVQYHGIKRAARDLAGHELPDRAHAGRTQDRQADLPLREGEVSGSRPAARASLVC